MLQARMFSYPDAARYRVGPNYQQLPNNRPINSVYNPYSRDGPGTINGNYGADPDYVKSQLRKVTYTHYHQTASPEQWSGQLQAYSSEVTDKDFEQPRALWEIIKGEENGQQFFLDNIVPSLSKTEPTLRNEAIGKYSTLLPS